MAETTVEASLENIRSHIDEAQAKVSEHKTELDTLLQDSTSSLSPSDVEALNQISTNLESMGSLMASIGSLGSGRRATSEDCGWMTQAKDHFENINEAIDNALEAIDDIHPTDVSSLDSLLLEMQVYYESLKTTHETIVNNLETSISEVCPDITITEPITTTEVTTTETLTSEVPTTTDEPTTTTEPTTEDPTTTVATTTEVPTTEIPTTTAQTTTEVPTTRAEPTTT